MVFVITPDSVAFEVCRIELDYATEASKCLVPIIARETPSGGVPAAPAELNWLSFLDGTDFEAGVDRLVEILDTDIDRVHLHTRLLTQARAWATRDRDRSLLLRATRYLDAAVGGGALNLTEPHRDVECARWAGAENRR